MSEYDPFAAMRTLDGPVEPPGSFSEQLYASLRHSLDRQAIGVPSEDTAPERLPPRRGLLVAAAVVASFLLMGGLLSWLAPPGQQDANVDPLPLSEPDPAASTSLVEHNEDPTVASPPPSSSTAPTGPPATIASLPGDERYLDGYSFGGWTVLPASEFDGRLGAAIVWTGEQLIVWGGEVSDGGTRPDNGWPVTNSGGAYDPQIGTWTSLPPAPLSARSGATSLWTGTEMLVIGGAGPDGAAYSPSTRRWRDLPLHTISSNPAAVWTGSEALLFGGLEPSGDAYNPTTDAWRTIATLDTSNELWDDPRAIWTGEEMIVWNSSVRGYFPGATVVHAFDIAAYDPETDSWRRLPPQPFEFELSNATGVWTGEELILVGANFERAPADSFAEEPRILAVGFNPATDTWRKLAPPPFSDALEIEGFGIHSSVWAGDRLLVWAGGFVSAEPIPELWAYDPASNTWQRGASSPVVGGDPELIWGGATLYATGGEITQPVSRVLTLPLAPGEPLPAPIAAANTVELPTDVPFEILALEPFVQSAFVGDFDSGRGRFYDQSDTFLQDDAISAVEPLWNGWMTSANGEVWWFPDSISRLPIALQNAPNVDDGLLPFTYFLPARDDLFSDRIWTVVPGDGFTRPNARSIVRSISLETREVRTYTEVPPDAFPMNASTTGLLLNSFEWMDTGDGFTEDPATFKMMVVEPDGNLRPLWAGFGLDLSVNRVVWAECDDAGAECAIVVSSINGPSPADLRIEIPGFSYQGGAVASPNGRWLAVGLGRQGRDDRAILIVDLVDGSYELPLSIAGRNLSTSFAPTVTWSADSDWILSLDGGALAIRLEDGFTVSLAEHIPEGMVVYGVAAR